METILESILEFRAQYNVELLTAYEGDRFVSTSDPIENVLSIISVHSMRRKAIENLLEPMGIGWEIIEELLQTSRISASDYDGETYFLRSIQSDS